MLTGTELFNRKAIGVRAHTNVDGMKHGDTSISSVQHLTFSRPNQRSSQVVAEEAEHHSKQEVEMPKKSGAKRAEKTKKRQQKLKAKESRLPQEPQSLSHEVWPYEVDDFDDEPVGAEFEEASDPMMVRRMMEREFAAISRGASDVQNDPQADALQKAQELCFDAFEARSPKQAEKLARQALKICPDCADAYNILAEAADNVTDGLAFYEAGVAAGRRALADEWDNLVENDAFWGYMPTRPFMRAMQGKASALWGIGRRDEGLATYLEMLQLNSNDNQGIRSVVVPMLIEMNRDAEALKILKQFKEDSCFALFDRALLQFRKSGDSDKSRKALRKAIKSNQYAVAELLRDRPSTEIPGSYSWESPEEAQCYVDLARRAWKMSAGAVAWLRKATKNDPPVASRDSDVDEDDVAEVLALPQDEEGWELSVAPWNNPQENIEDAEESGPCWALSISRLSDNRPLDSDIFTGEPPTGEDVRNFLVDTMLEPSHGAPRRPIRIEILDAGLYGEVCDLLAIVGIEAAVPDDADERQAELMGTFASAEKHEGELSELPLANDESWFYDCRQVDAFLENDNGEMARPWVYLLLSPEDGPAHMFVSMNEPSAEEWVRELERAIRQPQIGEARRPETIFVQSNDHRLILRSFCEQHGIDCRVADQETFQSMDFFFQGLSQHMRGPIARAAYVEIDGNTNEQLGGFFEASADFYRQAPWQFTPSDSVWRVEAGTTNEPWWAVVLGQNGETFGLALYDDWQSLVGMMTGQIDGPDVMSHVSCVCFNYEESQVMAGADLDGIEQFGWPIAAPEAYPLVYRTKPGTELHTPPAEEFRWLEAILRTLPDFIKSGKPTGNAIAELSDGTCEVTLTRLGPADIRPGSPKRGRR